MEHKIAEVLEQVRKNYLELAELLDVLLKEYIEIHNLREEISKERKFQKYFESPEASTTEGRNNTSVQLSKSHHDKPKVEHERSSKIPRLTQLNLTRRPTNVHCNSDNTDEETS